MESEASALKLRIRQPRTRNTVLVAFAAGLSIALCVVFRFYSQLWRRSSVGTSALVSGCMCALSQCLIQLFLRRSEFTPILKFMVWGVCSGVWSRLWTALLNSKYDQAIRKVLWDQCFGNPVSIFMYMSLSAFWEGYNVDLYLEKNFTPAFKKSLLVWPLASFLQFYVIPDHHITLFATSVNFIWTLILGLITL